ncbi:hypothetical protein MANY_22630 [Mycolicibacterium anyangense]|uniref:Glyoxalase-like domain-containing protein n=1 Tax=Mycolicibacterium anyangense TaxID=1431246 RepID=A0A6N4W4Q5_9MYCO|nr:hypothetical protein [Mycolicibacterium anyangense]BBZ76926.1 hypothetical protein MANY_22630 [Mycolicibacterium anyangense]
MVLATDGHLPYPFGREVAGYQVGDVATTTAKAVSAGAAVLSAAAGPRHSAMLQFPGGYIAELHSA